jgi:hypothetical protein
LGQLDSAIRDRRLSDKLQSAIELACAESDLITAWELLSVLEEVLLKAEVRRDRREVVLSPLVALHEKLWLLKVGSSSSTL